MFRGKPQILVAESRRFSPEAAELLENAGVVTFADLEEEELAEAVAGFDILWVRLRTRVSSEIMGSAKGLRAIVTPTTGLNHIDLEEASKRKIAVLSLRGEVEFLREVRATAEHTVGLLLAMLRKTCGAHEHVCNGGWDRDRFWGSEICGKTVGIVGYGRLGALVARALQGFDARVIVTDPALGANSFPAGLEAMDMERLLRESDIVTLHVDLKPETEGFFTRKHFLSMKRGAYFVNTARGELIDEAGLLEALKSGQLAGAALDVLAGESSKGMREHPIVRYARTTDKVVLSPHIGGCTWESVAKAEIFMARKLGRWLDNEQPGQTTAEVGRFETRAAAKL